MEEALGVFSASSEEQWRENSGLHPLNAQSCISVTGMRGLMMGSPRASSARRDGQLGLRQLSRENAPNPIHELIRSRHAAASGTISSARTHVNPRAASVCAYAHCATRLEVASSPTIPCCPSASPNCAPYFAFRSVQAARCWPGAGRASGCCTGYLRARSCAPDRSGIAPKRQSDRHALCHQGSRGCSRSTDRAEVRAAPAVPRPDCCDGWAFTLRSVS